MDIDKLYNQLMKHTIILLSLLSFSISFAQDVVGISLSDCDADSSSFFVYSTRLISKKIENDTLSLQIGVVRNCGFEPKIALTQKGDSLMIEIDNISEEWMSCECCFEMNIKAIGVKDTSFTLFHKFTVSDFTKEGVKKRDAYLKMTSCQNKYIFPSISEIELAPPNNNYTLDSLKIGPWHIYDEQTKKLKAKAYYVIDEKGESITLWSASFNEKGKLVQICANAGVNSQGKAILSCASKEEYLELNLNRQ